MADYRYPGLELDLFRQARNWKRYIRQSLSPYIQGDVLEVGAGIGTNTALLFSNRVKQWDCLEPDARLAARLRNSVRTFDRSGEIRVIHGTLTGLPEHSLYDVVLYIDVLEHIENDKEELRQAAGHLRRGGSLIVLAPAHSWLMSQFDRNIGHVRRYARSSLLSVAPYSLHPILVRYLDSVGLTASLMNRLILKRALPTTADILFWDRFLVPCSLLFDPLLSFRLGKSILVVWRSC